MSSLPINSIGMLVLLMPIRWQLRDSSEEYLIEYLKTCDPSQLVEVLFQLEVAEKNIYLDLLFKAFEGDFITMFKDHASALKGANYLKKTLNAYEKNLN